jgi:STE24 endopeptidase
MKAVLIAGLLIFVAVFVGTTLLPDPAARAEAAKYFTQEEINQGLRFSFERRLFFWTGFGIHVVILTWIVFTGFARKLADGCLAWTGGRWLVAVLLVGAFCFLIEEAISLPLGLARLEHLRAWGMTHRSVASWFVEHSVGLWISAMIAAVALAGLYLLIRFFPRRWWALAAVGTAVLAIFGAFILPVWIAPLFNTFTPLEQTPWADLQGPVKDLARRAGVPVQGVLVADASRQGSYTNAYFSGFGSTQRIVLYDTLLRAHTRLTPPAAAGVVSVLGTPSAMTPYLGGSLLAAHETLGREELESILAHEMGHWLHSHIVKGIGLATLAALFGFYVLFRLLRWAVQRPVFALANPQDPGGVPLVILASIVGLWLASPLANAVSRHFERQADMVSLDLTERPEVFIEAEKRLARDNISNVAPSAFSVWFFNTHPPAVERIQMAERWKSNRQSSK